MEIVLTVKNARPGNTLLFEVVEGTGEFTFSHGVKSTFQEAYVLALQTARSIFDDAKRNQSLKDLPRISVRTDCIVKYL